MADNQNFHLRIITPDRMFYEGDVDMVEFNTTEGEIGVLPGHIPLTVIVKPGILVITEKDGQKEAALHAGFAEILPEEITILAEIIEWPEEIDEHRAEEAMNRAKELPELSEAVSRMVRGAFLRERAGRGAAASTSARVRKRR